MLAPPCVRARCVCVFVCVGACRGVAVVTILNAYRSSDRFVENGCCDTTMKSTWITLMDLLRAKYGDDLISLNLEK